LRRLSLSTRRSRLAEEAVTLRAAAEELDAVHHTLARFWRAVDATLSAPPTEVWRLQFATAVGEIAANIVRYAYPNGDAGTLCLRFRLHVDRVEAHLIDQGVPFRLTAPPPRALSDDPMELPEGGYGLHIARAALDHVRYRRTAAGANSWRLVKRFSVHTTLSSAPPDAQPSRPARRRPTRSG
jgi:anti-sigma regulatory factor (Ser/Thr protein kinase)